MSAGPDGAPTRATGHPDADADGRVVVTLDAVPGLGGLFAKGVAKPVLRRLPGREPAGATVLGPGAGTTLAPVTYRVGDVDTGAPGVAERLAAYDRHVGEPVSDVLPAGFVHVLAFPLATAVMARGDFPLPLVGLVHLANAVEVRRPIVLGDRLEVLAHAENLRPHRRGTSVDLVTEARIAGETAWRGVSTYLAKGVDLGLDAADDTTVGDLPGASGTGPDASGWTPPLPTARWRLDAATGRRYAAISGDRNPIHLSALSAKAFGFPRTIAHGMDTAARALASVARERGETYDWTVEFAAPVLLPGTVDVSVRPASDGVDRAAGTGRSWDYAGWHPRTGRKHFSGAITPR